MYYMIHASDHPRAARLMPEAYREVGSNRTTAGTMRFLVVVDDLKLNRLPRTIDTTMGKQAKLAA